MKRRFFLILLMFVSSVVLSHAQRIVYTGHTDKSSRILETNLKKVTKFGDKTKKFYMWAGLTSLDIKGVAIYYVKVMYTSEFRLTIEKDAPLVLTMKNGENIILKSANKSESKYLDGVETMFASYEIKEEELIDISRNGIVKIAPMVTCFGKSNYEEKTSMWRLARPLSLRYELIKEYINKHPE